MFDSYNIPFKKEEAAAVQDASVVLSTATSCGQGKCTASWPLSDPTKGPSLVSHCVTITAIADRGVFL